MSGWNFRELASFIEYKAALPGARNLRRPQGDFQDLSAVRECFPLQSQDSGWFKCTRCGYQSDADRVGALNIAAKALDALGHDPEKGERDTP